MIFEDVSFDWLMVISFLVTVFVFAAVVVVAAVDAAVEVAFVALVLWAGYPERTAVFVADAQVEGDEEELGQ